ncbi:MAG: hypothetical protein AB1726_10390 [Planctomycetota bacterium]
MADDATADPERSTDPLDDFWRFLGQAGTIDPEVIREHREQYRERWVPLTVILQEERILGMSQIAVLLRKQLAEPHLRLGDLAVREGFCSREDVERALVLQEERCTHPIDLVLGDERIEPVAAVDALKCYVQHLEGRVRSLERRLAGESVLRVHRGGA